MNQQERTEVNKLLKAAMECRETCAAFMRVLIKEPCIDPDIVDAVTREANEAGVEDGFGVRLQESIARMEALLNEKVKEAVK